MAVDPRKFLIADCPVDQQAQIGASGSRRNFFGALGKIGDLAVLNDVGAGKVGDGLRTLTHVANAVRTGRSVVPGKEGQNIFNSTLGRIVNTGIDAVESGANVVLDTVGLSRAAATVAEGLNPNVANIAVGAAKQIYQKVKQGNFKTSDIPTYFQDLQNLETLIKGIYTGNTESDAKMIQGCVSPYASDLIAFAPKFKFMFVVQFTYSPAYSQEWSQLANDFAFVIKTSSRPTVDFEYDEINMYNFRTRVPKRTVYQPMTMTFYDDNKNNANLFYTAYLRAISPISNMGGRQTLPVEMYQAASMSPIAEKGTTFGGGPYINRGGASLGSLVDNTVNVIERIRLYHIFEYGRLMNVYHFHHPKILQMNLDDVTMLESGAGSEMSLQFAYDSMYVEPNYNIQDTSVYNISTLSGNAIAKYPIKPEFGDTPALEDGTPNAPSSQNMNPIRQAVTLTSSLTGLRSNAFDIPGFGTTLTV